MSEHSLASAECTIEHIAEMIAAMELAQEEGEAEFEGEMLEADSISERIEEYPLSVDVRSGWNPPGRLGAHVAEEFRILLSTGGPAVDIIGNLNQWNEPESATLRHQDWHEGWQEHHNSEHDEALLAFCRCFYFGE